MLRDELIRYYSPTEGPRYNCAEAMMRALNDYYRLNLPKEVLCAASSFGGGCAHDEMCGGIASSLAVLGILFSNDGNSRNSLNLIQLRKQFFTEFDAIYQQSRCNYLRNNYSGPGRRCEPVLVNIADIIEKIITENLPEK